MISVKRVVLDVLKPHTPNIHEFAKAIAEQGEDYEVRITVEEVDEKTESVVVIVEGKNVHVENIVQTISGLGGSLHSVDEVVVAAGPGLPGDA